MIPIQGAAACAGGDEECEQVWSFGLHSVPFFTLRDLTGSLKGWKPRMALALPCFPTQENFPASWSLGLTGQEPPPPPLVCRDGWMAAPFGFEDEAPSVPQRPLPRGFTSGWERKKKNLFSKWAEANSARQRGIDPGRRAAASRGQPQPADPRLPAASPATGNWIHE